MSSKEVHRGHFTRHSKVLGSGNGVWNAPHTLETITHGNEKGTIKPSLGQLLETDNVLHFLVDSGRSKSFQLIDVEDPSAFCVAETIVISRS